MTEVRLTKVALKECEAKLVQLKKYLPTLKLKKSLLQSEVNMAEIEEKEALDESQNRMSDLLEFSEIFSVERLAIFEKALMVEKVEVVDENIAGVDVPKEGRVIFQQVDFKLMDTPFWFEEALETAQRAVRAKWRHLLAMEKKKALMVELRNVTIRVNLFEKVLIPKIIGQINKIKIFLGDLMLGDIAKAKIAKKKIEKAREELLHE